MVHGAVLALIVGWLLYIGKTVWIPVVLGAVVVYVIVGVTQLLERVPIVGGVLPLQLRYLLAIALIGSAAVALALLAMAQKDRVIALAPQYQAALLVAIQKVAVWFQIESEPTWASLRQDLMARINLQLVLGSVLASVSGIGLGFVVVMLYAVFLLVEQHGFARKLTHISDDPHQVERVAALVGNINRRIGSYLALKTLLSVVLAAISWAIMAFYGLDFAGFWAVLIGFLNFIPYIGSVIGVLLPGILAVVQFDDVATLASLLVALTATQFVIGNFVDPMVMGSSLNLSPLAILIALAVWSELWGIPGAFLAVPITAIVVIVLSEFPGARPVAVLLSRDGRL